MKTAFLSLVITIVALPLFGQQPIAEQVFGRHAYTEAEYLRLLRGPDKDYLESPGTGLNVSGIVLWHGFDEPDRLTFTTNTENLYGPWQSVKMELNRWGVPPADPGGPEQWYVVAVRYQWDTPGVSWTWERVPLGIHEDMYTLTVDLCYWNERERHWQLFGLSPTFTVFHPSSGIDD